MNLNDSGLYMYATNPRRENIVLQMAAHFLQFFGAISGGLQRAELNRSSVSLRSGNTRLICPSRFVLVRI
jgi:hypothetical protein